MKHIQRRLTPATCFFRRMSGCLVPSTIVQRLSVFLVSPFLLLSLCPATAPAAQASGTVIAWGDNSSGQTTVPAGLSNVIAVAAGGSHSLALRADGTVTAWGDNSAGWATVPTELTNVVAVAAGSYHSVALRADGTVAVWGAQTYVPPGLSNVVAVAAGWGHSLAVRADGTVAAWNSECQTDVPAGLSNVVAVAGSESHSLALRADGTIVVWGSYYDSFNHNYIPMSAPPGLSNVVAVAAAGSQPACYSLILRADGTVGAWSLNDYGQSDAPAGLSNVVAVAAGWSDSLALRADGTVVTWARNGYGQSHVQAGLANAVAVAAGDSHSMALVGLSGGLAAPQLVGSRFLIGTVDRPFRYQIMALNGATSYGTSGLPPGLAVNPITGLITGQPLQAGTYSVVMSATNTLGSGQWTVTLVVNLPLPGLVVDGLVETVLANRFNYHVGMVNELDGVAASGLPSGLTFDQSSGLISGSSLELGDFPVSLVGSNRYGITTALMTIRVTSVVAWGGNYSGPSPTNVPPGLGKVAAVAAGGDMGSVSHSLALREDGTVAAWGDNSYGQSNAPTDLSNVVAVAAGSHHSLALRADGTVALWGSGSATNAPIGLSDVVAVAAGSFHNLALKANGIVVAWGDNSYRQTIVPAGLSNVVAVAAGSCHSVALSADGKVVAWGSGYNGETNVPASLSNVVAVAAGGHYVYGHTLALRSDGTLVAWGYNYYGQTNVPTGLSNVVAVAAGGGHSLALRADGTVVAWGSNSDGQTNVPTALTNVVAVSAGAYHSLALTSLPSCVGKGTPWARRVAKTLLADDELAMGLTTDTAGNLYVAGWFDGVNDFCGRTLTSYGGQDAFVAKYSSCGKLQWVRQAGSTDLDNTQRGWWDTAHAVGVDGLGNVYVAGGFIGTATFGGTTLTLTIGNGQDAFLAKYDSAGVLQWVRQGRNAWHGAYGTGLAVDSAGNSLMVGYFSAPTVSFGSVTATNPSDYGTFIVKHDSTGTALWARGLGGGSETYSTTVGMDGTGNCYIAGSFKGTLQLGTTNLTCAVGQDGFVAKYNSAGVLQWARQVAGGNASGARLGVDADGNSYLVGNFTNSASFGTTNVINVIGYAFYVARYDTSGNLQWVRKADSASLIGNEGGCAIDASGNCYIPGIYSGTVDFGGTVITNRGGWDIFAAKYDGAGNFQWVQTGGGTGNDGAFKMAVDTVGNCYMAGWFQGTALIGTNTLTAQGYWDTFVARIAPPAPTPLRFCCLAVSNGIVQMRLDGTPGVGVVVDSSFDLATWNPWQTNTLPADGLPLVVPMGTNRNQFFKARIP